MEDPSFHRVKTAIELAVIELLTKDVYLLHHNVSERAITHRLALHLTPLFRDYDVDCEYNRNFDRGKYIYILDAWRQMKRIHRKRVGAYPDIIVHNRGSNARNLLVIEAKKSNGVDFGFDYAKLEALKMEPYRYAFRVFIIFGIGADTYVEVRFLSHDFEHTYR